MEFLKDLNNEQIEPVKHTGTPALVLAGAGSGKTRVITYRIAYLIDYLKTDPYRIFAVTFTNKAADEMKERVNSFVSTGTNWLWIGTFHSMCNRLLREFSELIPFSSNFVIYDEQDQRNLIKRIIKNEGLSHSKIDNRVILKTISNLKDKLIDEFEFKPVNRKQEFIREIFIQYQRRLSENDAMDFDDLLFNTYRLLKHNEEVRKELDNRFKYILVDEYQDTNHAQYCILKELSRENDDLFVVGDDDQSIYGFRGADINNILDFEKDFPDCKIFKLERNYRSTGIILDAASAIVKNNFNRKGKTLWTDKKEGKLITLFNGIDENDEARILVYHLKKELLEYDRSDILISYRTNAQSRALEDALVKNNIEYTVVGGLRFYQRKEIKDLLAYMQFLVNKKDSVSLRRIINTPRRGIGQVRREKIESLAVNNNLSLWEATKILAEEDRSIEKFVSLIKELKSIERVDELLDEIIDRTGYLRELEEKNTIEADSRIENIMELQATVSDFAHDKDSAGPEEYLQEISLRTGIDEWDKEDPVSLMTLHNTKGLEFSVVFITGLSENLLPHYRSIKEDNIEEERRLFYVGLTRAKEKVYLSFSKTRGRTWSGIKRLKPSKFLSEIPDNCLEGKNTFTDQSEEKENDYVEHPLWGRGKVLKVVDGDKLLISFGDFKKKIKKGFFNGR